MENKPEVKCQACGWEGDSTELNDTFDQDNNMIQVCPSCQSPEIEDYEQEDEVHEAKVITPPGVYAIFKIIEHLNIH